MPNHKLTYKIYAAYVYDDRHILNSFDFTNKKVLKKYLNYTLNPDSLAKHTRKVNLNTESKIITLSTCTNGAENTRYLVQGVLTKDEQTN
jgi:sortase B